MKHLLAIITDEVSQDLDTIISFAHEFGLDGIEIRSVFGKAFKDLQKADIKLIGEKLNDSGLQISGCASPVFKCPIDDATAVNQHIDLFKQSVEKAYQWNCKLIRVFTFLRRNTPSSEQELDQVVQHLTKIETFVKGTGIRIGLENEYSCMVGNGHELQKVISRLSEPTWGIVWDPCNILYMPGQANPVIDDFPLIRDRVIHFHVKNANRTKGVADHCVEISSGEIDFPLQLKLLKEAGYQGWISLETHWRKKELSKEAAHLPAGYAFSEGAEEASRICMSKLKEWVAA